MKIIIAIALATCCYAQVTLSPLNAEHGKRSRDSFTVSNGSYTSLAVLFEIDSLDMTTLEVVPLLPTTHIKMSQYSARIPAKSSDTVNFDITCDTYPCVTIIWSRFGVGGHTESGMAVAYRLGFVDYSCEHEKNCRAGVQARMKDKK